MYIDKIKEKLGILKEYALYDKKKTARIFLIVLIILAAIFIKLNADSNDNKTVQAETAVQHKKIVVDISGAVSKPGIYKVDDKTRLYEIIEMAGGLKAEADVDSINQAEYVEDGKKIIIPSVSNEINNTSTNTTTSRYDASGKININTADKNQLTELNGIGDAIAERIIEYRNQSRFNSIEDIKNVKGIGDATYAKIADQITV